MPGGDLSGARARHGRRGRRARCAAERQREHDCPDCGPHQPKDIWKSAIRNDASDRLPASQPSGPAGSNCHVPRQGSDLALPVRPATTSSPLSLVCRVAPLNGVRKVAFETSVKRAEAMGVPSSLVRQVVCWTRLPSVDRSKSHRSLGIAHSSRPPSRESAESTQMSLMVTLLSTGSGDEQLGVGQRARSLVGDQRDAVHTWFTVGVVALPHAEQGEPQLAVHVPGRRGIGHARTLAAR